MPKLTHIALATMVVASTVEARSIPPSLTYDRESLSPAQIPVAEKALQTVTAEPWFEFPQGSMSSDKSLPVDGGVLKVVLEGSSFDSKGNLWFVDVVSGHVFTLSSDKKLTRSAAPPVAGAAGLGLQDGGNILIAGVGDGRTGGSIVSVTQDGKPGAMIVPPGRGQIPDDLVFDSYGGFYFSDFRGSVSDPVGGIYYVAPDMKTITAVMRNLALPNGVALSPNGKALWFGEAGRNLLHRVQLSGPAQPAVFGATTPYYFGNGRPDSMRVDSDGNLYVAIMPQGRILIFNHHGFPIGQILIPGREKGLSLYTTAMAIEPGTNNIYILSSGGKDGGATIFRSRSFAKALELKAK